MFATRERACAGYLVDLGREKIWLDAGAGTWRNLLAQIEYDELTGIILTHVHPDHTTDVLQAYHALRYGQAEALPVIPLWAPQETIDHLETFSKGIGEAFVLHAVSAGDTVEVDGATIGFVGMSHPAETVGIRISQDDATFAYSSDTGEGGNFENLATDADLFMCEATSQNSDELWDGHLRAAQAGSIAARVGVKRLVLTHLRPGRDHEVTLQEARASAGAVPVELARDGATWMVGA